MVVKYELIVLSKEGEGYTSDEYHNRPNFYNDHVNYIHISCGIPDCCNIISFLKTEIINKNKDSILYTTFEQCLRYLGCHGCQHKIVCKDHTIDDRKIDQQSCSDFSRTCINHFCKFTKSIILIGVYQQIKKCALCINIIHYHQPQHMVTRTGYKKYKNVDSMINNSMTHYGGVSGCQECLKSKQEQQPKNIDVCCECFTRFTLFGSEGSESIETILKSVLFEYQLIDPLIRISLDYLTLTDNLKIKSVLTEQKLPVHRRNDNLNSRGKIRKCSRCGDEMCHNHQFEQISYTHTYHNNGSIKSQMPQSNYLCTTCNE